MNCLIGNTTGLTSKAVVNRSCGSGYELACEETKFSTDSGIPGWHFGANRGHYLFMDDTFPPNATLSGGGRLSGHATADFETHRLPVITHRVNGFTWAQVAAASPTVNVSLYSQIVARGVEVAAWQVAHAGQGKWGATFIWSFHHECNNPSTISSNGGSVAAASANWRAATQNIYEIWVSQGVQIWTGTSDMVTTSEGMILSLCLIDGPTSNHDTDKNVWWGPTGGVGAGGNAWMDAHCLMYMPDSYNRGPNFQSPAFLMGGIKDWSDAKRAYQTTQGRTHFTGLMEFGCRISSDYTSIAASWTNAFGTLAATPENWIAKFRDYVRDSWDLCKVACYWDATATFSYELDNTLAYWNGVVAAFSDPTFDNALSALPSVGATATELGMVW